MTAEQELNIIANVLSGDKNAFEQLVLANQTNVYNLALKMTRNRDDALDISQEAFIRAYQKLAGFHSGSRFSVWLYKITYNLCIDHLRRSAHVKAISLDSGDDDDGAVQTLEIPDLRNLPEDSAIRREMRQSIAEGINELPQKLREVLVLREINDLSYDEIAATVRISPGTVKSRLSRARLRLLKSLEEKGTIPDEFRLKITTKSETSQEMEVE